MIPPSRPCAVAPAGSRHKLLLIAYALMWETRAVMAAGPKAHNLQVATGAHRCSQVPTGAHRCSQVLTTALQLQTACSAQGSGHPPARHQPVLVHLRPSVRNPCLAAASRNPLHIADCRSIQQSTRHAPRLFVFSSLARLFQNLMISSKIRQIHPVSTQNPHANLRAYSCRSYCSYWRHVST